MSSQRTIQVKGIPMIKFQDKDKIDYLRKGKIYLKSLAYYRKREKDTGDDTVGDLFEAMIHANDGYILIPELGIREKLTAALIETSFSNCFVFCMLSLENATQNFQFSEEQKEKILGFGDTALLITDRNAFLHRVAVALERDGIKGYHGFINYYDETNDHVNYWVSLMKNGINHVAFWKRKRYAYQQEYRFLIEPPDTENDYYELDIGDISDISVVITAKEALNAMALPVNSSID